MISASVTNVDTFIQQPFYILPDPNKILMNTRIRIILEFRKSLALQSFDTPLTGLFTG